MSESHDHHDQSIKSKMKGQLHKLEEKIQPCKDKIKSCMPQKLDLAIYTLLSIASLIGFLSLACFSQYGKCSCKDLMRHLFFFGCVFAVSRIVSTTALFLLTATICISPGIFYLHGYVKMTLTMFYLIVFASTIGLMFVKGMWKNRHNNKPHKNEEDEGTEVPPVTE